MFQTGKQEQEQNRAEREKQKVPVFMFPIRNLTILLLCCFPWEGVWCPIPLYLRQRLSGKDMDTLCSAAGSILVYTRTFTYTLSLSLCPSLSFLPCWGSIEYQKRAQVAVQLAKAYHLSSRKERRRSRGPSLGQANSMQYQETLQFRY